MDTGRLEAFSDGVFAIIITIMVLELKIPRGGGLEALQPIVPVLSSYVLSFIFVGIYWNNHHHMLQAANQVDGRILWANLHLLFWLSLIPFATGWMGENHFTTWPVAVYGFLLLMSGLAYTMLARSLIRREGRDSKLAKALGKDYKGLASLMLYALAIGLAFVRAWIAVGVYILVAAMWFIPDRRIERVQVK